MKPEKDIANQLTAIFLIAVVTASFFILLYAYIYGGHLSNDHSRWAEFGDYIGGVLNPVFGFFGLFALLLTISLQSKELKLTREELISQNETLALQNFENSFFQMLRLHNDILNSIDFASNSRTHPTTGRDCFPVMFGRFGQKISAVKKSNNGEVDLRELWQSFYDSHQLELGHYFRYLYNLFKFIHNSQIADKKFYSNLVRAQLSNHELAILFYNCYLGEGKEKFLPLAIEYSVFKNLSRSILLDKEHINWLIESIDD